MYSIYKAMDGGQCTDDFTAEIIMSIMASVQGLHNAYTYVQV